MSTDDPSDGDQTDADGEDPGADVRDRLEQEADRAVEQFDEGIVDLLAWLLDTETRARIYVNLRQHPYSTSEEVAEGTGLYPSTVREALAELHDEGKVVRQKRESGGAGNNPYEYATIPPSELVGDVVDDVQRELNTVFNLDRYLGSGDEIESDTSEPVTINVEDEEEGSSDGESSSEAAEFTGSEDADGADDDTATDEE